mmetsp:Transcript_31564/g.46061  ORF Transcript_31564/g.46061 Transcript_31564/m.46061 type:complete len:158 (+) Transcript_31564:1-474(+)
MMVLFFIGTVIVFLIIALGWDKHTRSLKLKWIIHNPIIRWIYWKPMVFIMHLVMGRSSAIASATTDENVDENRDRRWPVAMKQIHNTINKSVERSEQRLMNTISSLESRLKESERQRAEEMVIFTSLESRLEESEKERVKDMDLLKHYLKIQDPHSE